MEFEYRRPDVEQALMNARDLGSVEAALKAVAHLTTDLAKPDVYGHKLFAPGLDAAVPVLARRLGLRDVPARAGRQTANENVCIVATRLYASGGHSKVAYDISELVGAERVSAILTDIYGQLKHTNLIGAPAQDSPLKRRATMLLGARDLVGKTVELYQMLAAVRPTRIFMLTHHFDMVAALALWPFRDVVEFLHHADHVPAVGATLPFAKHVDLTWTCHRACCGADLPALYAGMTVRQPDPEGVASAASSEKLRIATCGPLAKFRGAAQYRWTDYVVAALAQREDATFIHVGPVDDALRSEIEGALRAAGIDPARYAFTGYVPDLASTLRSEHANVYVGSYPVTGGKANLEAMAVGIPTLVPVDEASPPLLQFDFPAATWAKVHSPDELGARLADPSRLPSAETISDELVRFERYMLDAGAAEN